MPRKVFVAGEILTAADVNTNLMDQSVMVFDDATARTTAIPSPLAGMVTYLVDTDSVEKFDGSNFVGVATAPAILQVVQGVKTDAQVSAVGAGDTVAVSNFSASITPSATSSKILVTVDVSGASSDIQGWAVFVKRDGTAVSVGDTSGTKSRVTAGGVSSTSRRMEVASMTILDTPATTSSVTYTVEVLNTDISSKNLFINRSSVEVGNSSDPRSASRITLMEVAG